MAKGIKTVPIKALPIKTPNIKTQPIKNVKCIPGVFCIENMTLFLMFVITVLIIYLIYILFVKQQKHSLPYESQSIVIVPPASAPTINNSLGPLMGLATRNNPFEDPYSPPLKNDGIYFPTNSSDIRGVPGIPINVQTRGFVNNNFQQIGILTKNPDSRDMPYRNKKNKHLSSNQEPEQELPSIEKTLILPLFGRRNMSGRDKWQYYTMSNTGFVNTKLPVFIHGKSCTSEYGCDEIMNGDIIYVEGYNDTFRATVYENGLYRYLPF